MEDVQNFAVNSFDEDKQTVICISASFRTSALFKWRHFLPEIILLNVRWYCRYALSRDLEEMMSERGVDVDYGTINRSRAEVCAGA